jgi:hypothetical protein
MQQTIFPRMNELGRLLMVKLPLSEFGSVEAVSRRME